MSEVAAHTSSFAWEDADCPPPHPATSSASDATATVMAFGWCMGPPSRCPGAASSSRSDDELALPTLREQLSRNVSLVSQGVTLPGRQAEATLRRWATFWMPTPGP